MERGYCIVIDCEMRLRSLRERVGDFEDAALLEPRRKMQGSGTLHMRDLGRSATEPHSHCRTRAMAVGAFVSRVTTRISQWCRALREAVT